MTDLVEAMIVTIDARAYARRTAGPGLADAVVTAPEREQSVDFQPGIPDLAGGQADVPGLTPSAPVLNFASGGFFVLMPVAAGDEVFSVVSDRTTGVWRDTKNPQQVDPINGKRTGSLSDACLFPFAFTAPTGAPSSWSSLLLGGPAGVALEVETDGSVTITKQGTPAATITLDAAGSVTIEVIAGQSVKLGGAGAVELAKAQALESAIDALIAAGVGAGTGTPGTTGTLAFTAAQTAWNLAKSAIPTTLAKGV
jgi:hypothetical protein